MSLTEQLAGFREQSRKETPQDTLAFMDRSFQDLSRSGIVDRSLKVGNRAPDFVLPNQVDKSVRLSDLLAGGPAVVSFYRGSWCPFCTFEMQALQRALPSIIELGATLVAISPQTPDHSLSTAEKNRLTYEVLSDVGNVVAREFGIVFHLQDEMQSVFREFGLDLPEYNGDDTFDLPVPATYVIDTAGIIRLAFVDPDYTRRLDPAEILSALRELKSATYA